MLQLFCIVELQRQEKISDFGKEQKFETTTFAGMTMLTGGSRGGASLPPRFIQNHAVFREF